MMDFSSTTAPFGTMASARSFGPVFAALLVAAPLPLAAQEEGPTDAASVQIPEKEEDEEEKGDEEAEKDGDEKEPRLETNFLLTSEVHTMNNLDLRELDESSDQAIIETDDRQTFAYTGLAAEFEYDVLESTEFNAAAAHTGLWGNDQLGGLAGPVDQGPKNQKSDEFRPPPNFLWIYRLSATWEPIDRENFELETTIGRQDFEIGGVRDDYFFDDTIDGVTIEGEFGKAGTLRLLPLDFYAGNSSPDDVDFVRYAANRGTTLGFRGDTNTFRFGGVYQNTKLVDGLDLRAFGFYSDIGASTRPGATGSDRTHHGSLGNFSDDDYSWMAGARSAYTLKFGSARVGIFGEYARSGGKDRKDTQIGFYDVDNAGNAFGAGIRGRVRLNPVKLHSTLRAFHADGGDYGSESGLQYNHGFVSFKGSEVGGLTLDRYSGFHPSAYVGTDGIEDTPNEVNRKSGTRFLQANLGADIGEKFGVDFDAWYLFDTSDSDLDQDRIEQVGDTLPQGWSRADLEAQQRFGEPLGLEVDTSLRFQPNDALAFYTRGSMFIPSQFYKIEVERAVAGGSTALGSADPKNFWAIAGGTVLNF